jgi:hypothetical protein
MHPDRNLVLRFALLFFPTGNTPCNSICHLTSIRVSLGAPRRNIITGPHKRWRRCSPFLRARSDSATRQTAADDGLQTDIRLHRGQLCSGCPDSSHFPDSFAIVPLQPTRWSAEHLPLVSRLIQTSFGTIQRNITFSHAEGISLSSIQATFMTTA